jgi:OmcA/MtrC family decaheme c-type cytochrome
VVDGTYTVGVWGSREFLLEAYYQENVYRSTSAAKTVNVLFGSATELTPNSRIASGDQCLTCHQDLTFHEGLSRGFEACILCHGTAGAEDLPRYVAGDAPATPGRQVDFRTMLHSIHAAQGLEDPFGFEVIGSALAPYPGNFEVLTFEDILFPARPGRTSHCARCHGDGNEAWKVPAPRDHPTQQTAPARSWGPVCVACHDSAETAGHVAEYSPSGGAESCSLCHGDGATWSVDLVHFTR